MPNVFTLSGTSLDAQNNPAYVGRYMVLRITSVGTDTADAASYPQDSVSFLIDENGDWTSGATLWVNGDSGILSYYEMLEPSGQRLEFVFPSAVEGTTVRYEYAIENYLAEDAAEQVSPALAAHIADTSNPHSVTAEQLGILNESGGVEIGISTSATTGGAIGPTSTATTGGAIGTAASTTTGFAGGEFAGSTTGGAVGDRAQSTTGFAGGYLAKASGTGRVQLGTGVNNTDSTIQFLSSGSVTAAEFGRINQILSSVVRVSQASDLAGTLDSSKAYLLDGIIDMGSQSITVPTGGLTILGQSFDISGLTSSEDNYTLFVSESIAIGSGNLLMADIDISVTGANSKVYELYDATGLNAIEIARVNYTDCTSLGDLYEYRQGLEDGTGRFSGSPSLTLHGVWLGGYRITTSIVRSLAGTMTDPLFKEGTLFQMNSRFLSDINCDLPSLAAFHDFSPINFPNPGTVQLQGCEITRDGSYDADDSNLTPNMDRGDLCSYWKRNNGLPNTFVGGITSITSEELTVISASSTYYDLEGIFTGTGLEHFSASADGKLTHLGNSPREFQVTSNLVLESAQNNQLTVRFRKWDNSASAFVDLDYTEQTRQVNNLSGTRDVAYFTILVGATLDKDDYLQLQVKNNSGNSDVTAELSSFFRIQER